MKKLFKLTIAIVAMAVLYSGCKKNEDSSGSNSSFTYDGKSYPLSIGVLENYGTNGEVFETDLTLLSSGLKIVEANGEVQSMSGTGHILQFELISTTGTKLDIGKYIFDNNGSTAGTLYDGGALINYSSETQVGTQLNITAGSVTVTKNSSEYELSYDCTTDDNKNIKGTFKGSLKYYSYETANTIKSLSTGKLKNKAVFLKK